MLLIAGIDPGTKVGWAVLDLNGNIVNIGSQKELSLDALTAKLHQLGNIILVGCDKAKTPSFVQSFATKVGAKTFSPKYDLGVNEKRSITKQQNLKQAHEIDALASAITALNSIQILTRKINSGLEKRNKLYLFDKVFDIVFNEEISIQAALLILEKPEIIEKPVEISEENNKNSDIIKLYKSLNSYKKHISHLNFNNKELTQKLSSLAKNYALLKEHSSTLVKPKPALTISREKERRIRTLSYKIKDNEDNISKLKTTNSELEQFLLQDNILAVKTLKNFSLQAVEKSSWKEDDIAFVIDPNEFSQKAVNLLKTKGVSIVLFSKKPGDNAKNNLPFVLIHADNLVLKRFNKITIIDKNKYNKVISSLSVIENIVDEYKKERSS